MLNDASAPPPLPIVNPYISISLLPPSNRAPVSSFFAGAIRYFETAKGIELSCFFNGYSLSVQKRDIAKKNYECPPLLSWPLADTNPSHYNTGTICFLFMTCKYDQRYFQRHSKKKKIKLFKPEFVFLGNSLLHIYAAW